ncbi:MAG: hypothetical protein HW421_1821 [Ignavibacteria bacterium]|nr:hypothetical protein [Ignavibacteria bacterium]
MKIKYDFYNGEQRISTFEIDTNRENMSKMLISDNNYFSSPENSKWLKLEYNQCEVCPLKSTETECCPAALDISNIALKFGNIYSYERIKVKVETDERIYFKETNATIAVNSLLGLVFATSGCPILSQFKGMARFHLPFSSFDETLVRTIGMYLLKQYYNSIEGKEADFELKGLLQLYKDMGNVNYSMTKRLADISTKDSAINAIASFFAMSSLIEDSIDTGLKDLKIEIF